MAMDLYAGAREAGDTDAVPSLAVIEIDADAEADTLLRIAQAMTLINRIPRQLNWNIEPDGSVRIVLTVAVSAAEARILSRRLSQLWQVRRLAMTHAAHRTRWEDGGETELVACATTAAPAGPASPEHES